MSHLLRLLGMLAVAFGLVWLVVIIWWQETNRAVSGQDVVLWMGVVPLLLLGALLLLRATWRWATRAPAATAAASVPAAPSAAGSGAAAAEQAYHLALIASGWSGSAGDAADVASQALQAGEIEPALDSAVRDGDGLPVLLAKHPALDVSTVEAWLDTTRLMPSSDYAQSNLRPRLLRCLALLDAALAPVLQTLALLFPTPADPNEPQREPPRVLQLAVIEPTDFTPEAMSAIEAYVSQQIRVAGWGPVSLQLKKLQAANGLAVARWLDGANVASHRNSLDDVYLLLGVDSSLDASTLQEYAMRDLFYAAKRPAGRIPGEAAAVLALMAPAALPPTIAVSERLHRIPLGVRDKPVDVRGRISDALLGELTTQALIASAVDASTCAAVISDGGRSVSRTEELALTLMRLLPDLDVVADRIDLATQLGDLGAAREVSLLVLGAARCQGDQQPVLIAGIADSRERFVAVLSPAAAPIPSS